MRTKMSEEERKAKRLQYRIANRAKLRANGAAHYITNRERIRAQHKAYAEANRDKVIERAIRYREADPEKFRQRSAEAQARYRARNPEKVRKQSREYAAKVRAENPERECQRVREYYARNRELMCRRKRAERAANPERARAIAWKSSLKFRATFAGEKVIRERHWTNRGIIGLTIEYYNAMCEAQGHVCSICRCGNRSSNGKPCGLAVDHDHKTHEVRGLLCGTCNRNLGRIEKVGLCGNHQCGADFTARAIAYMMTATLRRIKQSTN